MKRKNAKNENGHTLHHLQGVVITRRVRTNRRAARF